jgi:hypothetical protein
MSPLDLRATAALGTCPIETRPPLSRVRWELLGRVPHLSIQSRHTHPTTFGRRAPSSDSAMTHAVPAICGAALRHATAYFLMHRYSTSLLYSTYGIIIMHQTIKKDRPSG